MGRLKYIGEKTSSDLGEASEKEEARRWETTYCFAVKLLKKRERGGGRREEKSSRKPSNKADSAQIASERPTSQRGAHDGGKKTLQQPRGCCESWRKPFAKWEQPSLLLGSFLPSLNSANHSLDNILHRRPSPRGWAAAVTGRRCHTRSAPPSPKQLQDSCTLCCPPQFSLRTR